MMMTLITLSHVAIISHQLTLLCPPTINSIQPIILFSQQQTSPKTLPLFQPAPNAAKYYTPSITLSPTITTRISNYPYIYILLFSCLIGGLSSFQNYLSASLLLITLEILINGNFMMGPLCANITCTSLFLSLPCGLLIVCRCLLLIYCCRLCRINIYSDPNNTLH